MSYDPSRDPFATFEALPTGAPRAWYELTNDMVGAKELPTYGRGLLVFGGPAVTLTVVPLGETDDGQTRSIHVQAAEVRGGCFIPLGVRRIVDTGLWAGHEASTRAVIGIVTD